jgi:hypothetical protein
MKFVILFIALCLCSSCTSFHWLYRPGVTGTVVDSKTEAPVIGAKIVFSRNPATYGDWYFDFNRNRGLRVTNTLTASDGTFHLPPVEKWRLLDTTAPLDPFVFALSITREGYQPYTNRFWYPPGDSPTGSNEAALPVWFTTNFDKIRLERLQP